MHLVQIPFRWAALRGRYYVHLVQMHGPFPNSVRVGAPLFGGLSQRRTAPDPTEPARVPLLARCRAGAAAAGVARVRALLQGQRRGRSRSPLRAPCWVLPISSSAVPGCDSGVLYRLDLLVCIRAGVVGMWLLWVLCSQLLLLLVVLLIGSGSGQLLALLS